MNGEVILTDSSGVSGTASLRYTVSDSTTDIGPVSVGGEQSLNSASIPGSPMPDPPLESQPLEQNLNNTNLAGSLMPNLVLDSQLPEQPLNNTNLAVATMPNLGLDSRPPEASLNNTNLPGSLMPNLVLDSQLTVRVDHVGTMPFVSGPSLVPGTFAPNLGSPVAIKNKLYLIDQNDAIYRLKGRGKGRRGKGPNDVRVQQIFNVSEAPDGLLLDNRQSILNIAPGRKRNSVYVMFTSGSEPMVNIPIYRMPAPLPGQCCAPDTPLMLNDLYRIGPIPEPTSFFGTTRTEYQVLYEYKLAGNKLEEPRAIAAFETQSFAHNGGG